jgi:hypothetical protein
MTLVKAAKFAAIVFSLGGLVLLVSAMYAGHLALWDRFGVILGLFLFCEIVAATLQIKIRIDSRFDELKKYLEERQVVQEPK